MTYDPPFVRNPSQFPASFVVWAIILIMYYRYDPCRMAVIEQITY